MAKYCIQVILSISCLLLIQPVKAQFGTGTPEKIKLLYQRPLIVIEEVESPKVIEFLKKRKRPNEIERYRKSIADYNTNVKEAVEKFWKFNPNILYKTYNEADKIFRSKSAYYSVLYCATFENFKIQGDSGGRLHPGLNWYCIYKDFSMKPDYWDNYTVMEVKLIEEFNKPNPVFHQNLSDLIPGKANLIFALQAMQFYTQEKGVNKTAKTLDLKEVIALSESELSAKTLLVKDASLYAGLSQNDIKATYPYPFEILHSSEFDERVVQADPATAFVQIVPQVISAKNKIKIYYLHLVIDPSSGNVMAISSPGQADKSYTGITKDSLKDFVHSAKKPSRLSAK